METWITSDHHFGHKNIMEYNNRQFADIAKHDDALIESWNKVVRAHDVVYHLGDFTLGELASAREYFGKLNGIVIFLVNPWHHDKRWLYRLISKNNDDVIKTATDIVVTMESIMVLEPMEARASFPVVMCHYPFEVWDRKHYGAVHFHGHSHGYLKRDHNRLDVGVDMAFSETGEYRPFSLHEAISIATGYYPPAIEASTLNNN